MKTALRMITVPVIGRSSGNVTRVKLCQCVAPSTSAASPYSRGSARRNPV